MQRLPGQPSILYRRLVILVNLPKPKSLKDDQSDEHGKEAQKKNVEKPDASPPAQPEPMQDDTEEAAAAEAASWSKVESKAKGDCGLRRHKPVIRLSLKGSD